MDKFNPHILLVMRWLQNNDLVSKEELKTNFDLALNVASSSSFQDLPAYAAYAAANAAYAAANATGHWLADTTSDTKYWLDEYFELVKENRQAYENRAKHLNILGVKNE